MNEQTSELKTWRCGANANRCENCGQSLIHHVGQIYCQPTPSPIIQAAEKMAEALRAMVSTLSAEDIEFLSSEHMGSVCGEYSNGEAINALTALAEYEQAKGQ